MALALEMRKKNVVSNVSSRRREGRESKIAPCNGKREHSRRESIFPSADGANVSETQASRLCKENALILAGKHYILCPTNKIQTSSEQALKCQEGEPCLVRKHRNVCCEITSQSPVLLWAELRISRLESQRHNEMQRRVSCLLNVSRDLQTWLVSVFRTCLCPLLFSW